MFAALLIVGMLSIVISGASVVNLAMNAGSSKHVTCDGMLRVAHKRASSADLQCVSVKTTTTVKPTTTTRAKPATTTTARPTAPPDGPNGADPDPTPSFVACGSSRSSAMNSPYATFAAAKAAFPNTAYVDVPAGDNSGVLGQDWRIDANTTYYLEPGVHTIGTGQFAQIIPKNNDAFVGAPGAILDGQDQNAYAFTQHATGVKIGFLEVRHFVAPLDEGVVNHDAGAGWVMSHNYMHDNGGAAMILGDHNTAQYNCLDHNAQYGFQIFGDTVNVSFNEISRNDSANVESSNPGCGCSGGMKAWGAGNVALNDNWVHDNMNVGLWVDTNNVGFDISNNVITDNTAEAILYETSYNFHITNNYIARNGFVKGLENEGFPNPAIYISESGGDARVGSKYANSEVANNTLVDNWGGVTLWENANRYCAGAGGDHECTRVNPSVATMSTCGTTKLATQPYINDCRWKTQNVSVHDNSFSLTAANVPHCTAANGCGNNALISQYGTCGGPCSPGDPYMGTIVEDNVTYHQNNHFSNNTYKGPWLFEIHEQNKHVSFSTWKASPYEQDAGSTLTP
jgi:Right handed beta helix region